MTTIRFYNINDVIRANENAGYYFFKPDAMRFFMSRTHWKVYGNKYFITSERNGWKAPRLYTIREIQEDGNITSVSAFQQYASLNGAIAAVKRLVEKEKAEAEKEGAK